MFAKALLASVVFVLPVAGCAHHHGHDRDDERDVCYPRERVRYQDHYDHDDARYRNAGWHERDDRCR